MLSDFYSQGATKLNLFDDNTPKENSESLMTLLDRMNHRYGRGTLPFTAQGIEQPICFLLLKPHIFVTFRLLSKLIIEIDLTMKMTHKNLYRQVYLILLLFLMISSK